MHVLEPVSRVRALVLVCSTKDQIVMVNGASMENVHSNYTIQTLKACGRTANIVSVKHGPRLESPVSPQPTSEVSGPCRR